MIDGGISKAPGASLGPIERALRAQVAELRAQLEEQRDIARLLVADRDRWKARAKERHPWWRFGR